MNNNSKNQIAIIGIGYRIPLGKNENNDNLWTLLKSGYNGVVKVDRWSDNYYNSDEINNKNAGLISKNEWESFDPLFFGILPKDASTLDVQQKLLLKCAWECIQDAGLDPLKLRGTNTSCYIGATNTEYRQSIQSNENVNINMFNVLCHTLSNRISYCLDLRSESMTVDTACSSSLNAITLACNSILLGDSDLSIVGGVNFINDPYTSQSASYVGIISKSGYCNVFNESADGFVRGEGCGLVLLKRLDQAIKDNDRIYCVIDGYSSNLDSSGNVGKNNIHAPSIQSQSDNLNKAFSKSTLHPSEIDYIECHGTGTQVGDAIETESLGIVFKNSRSTENQLLIGSIKSNVGHAEPASGVVGLIKCCLMFKNRQFVPNYNFNNPNPKIKFNEWKLKVVTKVLDFPSQKKVSMVINNFGFTGSNSCLILSEFNNKIQYSVSNDQKYINNNNYEYLIPISANSLKSLNNYLNNLKYITNDIKSTLSVQEFVYFQSKCLPNLYQRRIIKIKSDWKDFNENIQPLPSDYLINENKTSNIIIKSENPTVVFVFCGQGPQYIMMASYLYNTNQVFKNSMDKIDQIFYKYYGHSTLSYFNSINQEKDKDLIYDPYFCFPVLFMFQVSLFEYYKSYWGIDASIIIGHSLGEISAIYCSGMISLDDACRFLYFRAIHQRKTLGMGKMLVVNLSENQFNEQFRTNYPNIEINCYNSPNSIVVSDLNISNLKEIHEYLKSKGIFSAFLGANASFHSSSQEIIKNDILNVLFEPKHPTIPIFSTVTSRILDKDNLNSNYMYQNIRRPVLFEGAINNIFKYIQDNKMNPAVAFIEISPHPTLTNYIKEMIPSNDSNNYFDSNSIILLNSLNRKLQDNEMINKTISTLYSFGYNINFQNQLYQDSLNRDNQNMNRSSIIDRALSVLPKYQWDDGKYWYEREYKRRIKQIGPSVNILGNKVYKSPIDLYKSTIDISKRCFSYLKGHKIRNNTIVFPGTGYIFNIFQLFYSNKAFNSNLDLVISTIEFKAPFILKDNQPRSLQTTVLPTIISNDDNSNEFNVMFHVNENLNDYKWQLCSNATVSFIKLNLPEKMDIELIKSKYCNLVIASSEDIYIYMKQMSNLNYSGNFKRIVEFHMGIDCTLAKVSLGDKEFINDTGFINTSILDCSIHTLICQNNIKCQLAGKSCRNFKFYSSNIPKDRENHKYIWVYGKVHEFKPDGIEGSVFCFLEDGTVFCEIENVTIASTTKRKDPLSIELPNNCLFKPFIQRKDSILPNANITLNLDDCSTHIKSILDFNYNDYIAIQLLNNIESINKSISVQYLNDNSIDIIRGNLLINNSNKSNNRLFNFIFNIIKSFLNNNNNNSSNNKLIINNNNNNNNNVNNIFKELFDESTRIAINKLLSHSTYQVNSYFNGLTALLNNFKSQFNIILNSVLKLIKQLPNDTNYVLRIIQIGSDDGNLTSNILKEIKDVASAGFIEIEYTICDASLDKLKEIEVELEKSSFNGSLLFKQIDLQDSFKNQNLNPNYYDLAISVNSLHILGDLNFAISEIQSILLPNAHLLLIEPQPSVILDCLFGVFEQWWSFENRNNACLNVKEWVQLLSDNEFIEINTNQLNNEMDYIICHAKKPSIFSTPKSTPKSGNSNVFIFGNNISNHSNQFIKYSKEYYKNITIIENLEQFESIKHQINNNSIIYNTSCLNSHQINNFQDET